MPLAKACTPGHLYGEACSFGALLVLVLGCCFFLDKLYTRGLRRDNTEKKKRVKAIREGEISVLCLCLCLVWGGGGGRRTLAPIMVVSLSF